MKSVKAAASVMTAIMLMIILSPAFCTDSQADAPPYVSLTDKITLTGFANYDSDSTTVTPLILVFVVHYNAVTNTYEYSNVSDGKIMSAPVYVNRQNREDPMNYSFSVEVPLITGSANYYICAFNSFKINSVSSSLDASYTNIVPDDTWTVSVPPVFSACRIKGETWSSASPGDSVSITGAGGPMDCITLIGARGTVMGHVDGLINGNTNNLSGVHVEFYNRNNELVNSATTDGDGNYSIILPTGDYKLVFVRGNYTCEPTNITVTEGVTIAPSMTMTITMDTRFFGNDLAHFLTIIGGVICAFTITVATIFQLRRIRKSPDGNEWILDDMDAAEDEKEEK